MRPRQGPIGPKKGQKAMMVAGMVVVVVLAVVGLVWLVRAKVLGGLAAQELERRLQGEESTGVTRRQSWRPGSGTWAWRGAGRRPTPRSSPWSWWSPTRRCSIHSSCSSSAPPAPNPTPPPFILPSCSCHTQPPPPSPAGGGGGPGGGPGPGAGGGTSSCHPGQQTNQLIAPQPETPITKHPNHLQLSPMHLCEAQMIEVNLAPKL